MRTDGACFMELATMRTVKGVPPIMGSQAFWKAVVVGVTAPASIYAPAQPYMQYANSVSIPGIVTGTGRAGCTSRKSKSTRETLAYRSPPRS